MGESVLRGPNSAVTLRPGEDRRAGRFPSLNALSLALIGTLFTISAAAPSPEPLFQAIRTGSIAQIKRALDGGISASAIDGNGTPALMLATLFGDAAVVKLMLDRAPIRTRLTTPARQRSCGRCPSCPKCACSLRVEPM